MTTIETVFVHPADQAEQRGTHYIEDSLSVYVMRDLDGADKWVLDPSVFGNRSTPRARSRRPAAASAASPRSARPPRCAWGWRRRRCRGADAAAADHLGYTLTKN